MQIQEERLGFYRKNGYWIERGVFTPDECNKICTSMRRYADDKFTMITNPDRPEFLIAQAIEKLANISSSIPGLGKKSDLIGEVIQTSNLMRSVMTDPRLVSILEDIQGQEVVALVSQFFFKEAGSAYAEQAWNPHQDNAYLNIKKGCSINTQLMLADADRENGAMYVFPGSHEEDILPFVHVATYGEEARKNPGRKCEIPDKYVDQKLDLTFKKGDFLMIDGNLIHGSYTNRSNRSRPVFAWQTCTLKDAGPGLGENIGENSRRMAITLRGSRQ